MYSCGCSEMTTLKTKFSYRGVFPTSPPELLTINSRVPFDKRGLDRQFLVSLFEVSTIVTSLKQGTKS